MKFGVAIRNMGPQSTPGTMKECAHTAEQLGFDALFVSDHLCIPPNQTEGSGGRYVEALTTLAWLAGVTDSIRLGTSVLVLPYRPAVLMAKQIASIQELAGGRLILGAGVGWMREEFEALGVDRRHRGAIATEDLRVIRHLFNEDTKPYDGAHVRFPGFVFLPRPVLPPIWVGGSGAAAIARAVEFGDGWHPMLPAAELKTAAPELKRKADAAGRGDMEIIVRRGVRSTDTAAIQEQIGADRDAGATYFIADFGRYNDEAEFSNAAEAFMQAAAPHPAP
ncbi:MAG: TIGR03619 family F420-dependent LLM class oxidoreductase [Candidatus Binataceae bacterium]